MDIRKAMLEQPPSAALLLAAQSEIAALDAVTQQLREEIRRLQSQIYIYREQEAARQMAHLKSVAEAMTIAKSPTILACTDCPAVRGLPIK